MKFKIYRYDPDTDAKPYFKEYDVALEPSDRMLLDALIRIKTIDDTLINQYDWETAPDTNTTWRIGDGTAASILQGARQLEPHQARGLVGKSARQ